MVGSSSSASAQIACAGNTPQRMTWNCLGDRPARCHPDPAMLLPVTTGLLGSRRDCKNFFSAPVAWPGPLQRERERERERRET